MWGAPERFNKHFLLAVVSACDLAGWPLNWTTGKSGKSQGEIFMIKNSGKSQGKWV